MKIKEVAETKLKVIQEVSVSMLFYKTLGPLRPQTYLEINVPIWKKEIHDFFQWLSPLLFLFANGMGVILILIAVNTDRMSASEERLSRVAERHTQTGEDVEDLKYFLSNVSTGSLIKRLTTERFRIFPDLVIELHIRLKHINENDGNHTEERILIHEKLRKLVIHTDIEKLLRR